MNPKFHFIIELTRLIGRFGFCLDTNDTPAFLRLVDEIIRLCENTKKVYHFTVQDEFFDSDDDEL